MTYMVPMELLVLPEDEEGTNWRWYTNQEGVERARPPPKPNEGQWGYLYHPIAHDWYRVPDDDYGMTSTTAYDEGTTTTAAPQYDGSYTNNNKLVWIDNQAGDDVGRVRPPPKPNEEQWWYHSTAHDWYRVPAPSSPTYNDNGYDNNGNHPIAGTYNHCTEGANQHGHHQPTIECRGMSPPPSDPVEDSSCSYQYYVMGDRPTSTPVVSTSIANTTTTTLHGRQYANQHEGTDHTAASTLVLPYDTTTRYIPKDHRTPPHLLNGCRTSTQYQPHSPPIRGVEESCRSYVTRGGTRMPIGGPRRMATTTYETYHSPIPDDTTGHPYAHHQYYGSNNHLTNGGTTNHLNGGANHTGSASHHDRHQPTIKRRPWHPPHEPYYASSALAAPTTITDNQNHHQGPGHSYTMNSTVPIMGMNQMTNHHHGGENWRYPTTDEPYHASTPMESCTSHLMYGEATMYTCAGGWGAAGGCTSTCTSHLVYGEAAAATTVSGCTSTCTSQAATPTMAAAMTMFGNWADEWGAYSHHRSNKHDDVWEDPTMATNHTTDHHKSSYTNYSHNPNQDDDDAKSNDKWGGTTMATIGGSSNHQLRESSYTYGPTMVHNNHDGDRLLQRHPHRKTTTSTLRTEDQPMRNYDRLQFDRGPRAPTMPTPPQPPTKPPATTMIAAAPMVAASSSTPAVYGSHCVGEWGAYYYIHSDTKGNEWDNNVMMAMTGTRVIHFAMTPHPLSHFHAGLYCFPVLLYKGQITPSSSSSSSSVDPCNLLHTVQWKGSSSEFHFPNVPKVAHLSVFLFGSRNALVPSPNCILPVKLSREVGSSSTCSYVEF